MYYLYYISFNKQEWVHWRFVCVRHHAVLNITSIWNWHWSLHTQACFTLPACCGWVLVMTSDLKPGLLCVTRSCDSLCSVAEKYFFDLPIPFSVCLRMMAGNSHKVFANSFDEEYIIVCKNLHLLWFFEKGNKEAVPLFTIFLQIKRTPEGINKTGKPKLKKAKSTENSLKRNKSQAFWQICQEMKC